MGKKITGFLESVVLLGVSLLIPGAGVFITAIRGVIFAAALSKLSNVVISAFVKTPRTSPPPINVTIRGTIEFRRVVMGTCRAGGVLVFYGTSGTNNKYLWYVIAYAGHQSYAFSDFWIDERRIASADIPSGAGGVVTASPWNSKLAIWKHLGTSSQTVDTNLQSAFGAWDSAHKLLGTTYAVIRFERDGDVYPNGYPQSVTALLSGALLYDSRKDSTNGGSGSHRLENPSTWEFSRDPVQMIDWILRGGSVHNDTSTRLVMYGLKEDSARINYPTFVAASNVCDESISGANAPPSGAQSRYRADLEWHDGEKPGDVIKTLLASMAGDLVYAKGQWSLYAGSYDAPVHSFTEKDLYGELETVDTSPHSARYNSVAPIFIDAGNQYIQTTGKYRTDAAYEAQDGEELPIELQLDAVKDQYQAQRLAEIHLRKSRMMRSVKLPGSLNLLKVAIHDGIIFSHSRYGWSNRVFRCAEKGFKLDEEAGKVVLLCQRDDVGVWSDMLTADYTTGTSDTDVFEDDNLRIGLRSDVQVSTFSSATITKAQHSPDGATWNDLLTSISYTPNTDCTVVLTATFTVDYTTYASGVGYLDFRSSIQDGTWDNNKRHEWFENAGVSVNRKQIVTITQEFPGSAGVAVTYGLYASMFNGSDTVSVNNGKLILTTYQ